MQITTMEDLLLPLGVLFVVSSIAVLILQSERREMILERLYLKRRRDSGSRTPPRSLSPGKVKPQEASAPDYSATFPPSRKFALVEAGRSTTSVRTGAKLCLNGSKRMLPIETSYLEAANDHYTPCEFSVAEIKALGDFPDYAALSGVPLPKPYHDFNIDRALPRPYRPFRWAYHQTMCKCYCASLAN